MKRYGYQALVGEDCFWYAQGDPANLPMPGKFIADAREGEGATIVVFDTVGGDVRRSVKHITAEASPSDRKRNGGWAFERVDLPIMEEKRKRVEAAQKAREKASTEAAEKAEKAEATSKG